MNPGLVYDPDALPEPCSEEGHVQGCPGKAGGDHEFLPGWDRYGRVAPVVRFTEVDTGVTIETRTYNAPVSMLRCSECGNLLDGYGECDVHGVLDDFNREGQPEFNGAFDRW